LIREDILILDGKIKFENSKKFNPSIRKLYFLLIPKDKYRISQAVVSSCNV